MVVWKILCVQRWRRKRYWFSHLNCLRAPTHMRQGEKRMLNSRMAYFGGWENRWSVSSRSRVNTLEAAERELLWISESWRTVKWVEQPHEVGNFIWCSKPHCRSLQIILGFRPGICTQHDDDSGRILSVNIELWMLKFETPPICLLSSETREEILSFQIRDDNCSFCLAFVLAVLDYLHRSFFNLANWSVGLRTQRFNQTRLLLFGRCDDWFVTRMMIWKLL